MPQLSRDPKVVQLSRDLGLSIKGDCLATIREFAVGRVGQLIEEGHVPVTSLDTLRRVVALKYRARIEIIEREEDVGRISEANSAFHPLLPKRLIEEFVDGTTEGLTLERDPHHSIQFRYLIVVDARGERAARAYFTAWHELTHLVVHPEQLRFPGFRRSPALSEIQKDALESLVDHIAGRLAFYPRLYEPVIRTTIEEHGGLTFSAIEAARSRGAPSASLFATAMGSINFAPNPMLLVGVGPGVKAEERRMMSSPQQTFSFASVTVEKKLRLLMAVSNDGVRGSDLVIRRNMRVPRDSILSQAFDSTGDLDLVADEDQSSWETSELGGLPRLPLRVEAIRRGRFVYGLITPIKAESLS